MIRKWEGRIGMVTELDGHSGCNWTGEQVNGGAGKVGAGGGESKAKNLPLAGDVQEYWGL